MNKEYLILLENIEDTMQSIKGLQEELRGILDNPGIALENLERIRDTLAEIKSLKEDAERVIILVPIAGRTLTRGNHATVSMPAIMR